MAKKNGARLAAAVEYSAGRNRIVSDYKPTLERRGGAYFQPAHVGQMEFYLRCLDKHERALGEESPIRLILCVAADAENEKIDLIIAV